MIRRRLLPLRLAAVVALGAAMLAPAPAALASPEEDRQAFVRYFQNMFPNVELDDFANGVYAIDRQSREQWEQIEEFPPYEETVEQGEKLYNTPFANGKGYADCFGDGAVRHNYPFYDDAADEVITLEYDINRCRKTHGEKPLKWERGDMVKLSAYMAFVSRGNRLDIKVEGDKALAAYERGKEFYYTKRGQLNNSCATCHVQGAGKRVRTEVLHPAIGEVTHWPNFRLKWGHIATLHKRISRCHRDQGSKRFQAQHPRYREVEYFMTYMSNGLPVNGPGVRK